MNKCYFCKKKLADTEENTVIILNGESVISCAECAKKCQRVSEIKPKKHEKSYFSTKTKIKVSLVYFCFCLLYALIVTILKLYDIFLGGLETAILFGFCFYCARLISKRVKSNNNTR